MTFGFSPFPDLISFPVPMSSSAKTEALTTTVYQLQLQFQELETKLDTQAPRVSRPYVKLNVGGKIFATTIGTLTMEKDTFFTGLFSGAFSTRRDNDGAILIDRDPTWFHLILNYLRGVDVRLIIQQLALHDKYALLQEVSYYSISSLEDLINPAWTLDPSCKHSTLQLSNANLTVTKTGRDGYSTILGQQGWTTGKHSWDVTIDEMKDGSQIAVGVCAKENLSPDLDGYDLDKSFWVSGRRHWKTKGNLVQFQKGKTYHIDLDCDSHFLNITGEGIKATSSSPLPPTKLFPFFNLKSVGNALTVNVESDFP